MHTSDTHTVKKGKEEKWMKQKNVNKNKCPSKESSRIERAKDGELSDLEKRRLMWEHRITTDCTEKSD